MGEEKVSFNGKIVPGADALKVDVQDKDGSHTYEIIDDVQGHLAGTQGE